MYEINSLRFILLVAGHCRFLMTDACFRRSLTECLADCLLTRHFVVGRAHGVGVLGFERRGVRAEVNLERKRPVSRRVAIASIVIRYTIMPGPDRCPSMTGWKRVIGTGHKAL